ncbi:MAG: hypothetical protein ABSA50_06985 [Candidatus Bathyarchaeia archaeon]
MATKKASFDFEDVVKRLDILLSVILSLPTSDDRKLTLLQRVELLSSAGTEDDQQQEPLLRNVEIARILGISPNHVGVLMDKLRKKAKRPKKMKKR